MNTPVCYHISKSHHSLNRFSLITELSKAVESPSAYEAAIIVARVKVARARKALVEAQKVATRTSGTRGKKARTEEIAAEERVRDAEATYGDVLIWTGRY
jgi:hypothetical protein